MRVATIWVDRSHGKETAFAQSLTEGRVRGRRLLHGPRICSARNDFHGAPLLADQMPLGSRWHTLNCRTVGVCGRRRFKGSRKPCRPRSLLPIGARRAETVLMPAGRAEGVLLQMVSLNRKVWRRGGGGHGAPIFEPSRGPPDLAPSHQVAPVAPILVHFRTRRGRIRPDLRATHPSDFYVALSPPHGPTC